MKLSRRVEPPALTEMPAPPIRGLVGGLLTARANLAQQDVR